jgi:hypothetical protein
VTIASSLRRAASCRGVKPPVWVSEGRAGPDEEWDTFSGGAGRGGVQRLDGHRSGGPDGQICVRSYEQGRRPDAVEVAGKVK